ncbi:hypothetical protein DVB88_18640, partial [Tsukamurella pulmonis]
ASDRVSEAIGSGDDSPTWHDRAHAAQEYGAAAVEKAKPAIVGAVDKAGPAITDAADKVKPALSDAVDRARPVLTDAADRARPVLADAADRARPVLADAAETASDLLGAASEKLHAFREDAADGADSAARTVRRKAPALVERARAVKDAAVAERK